MTGKQISNWVLGSLLAGGVLLSTCVYADSDDHEQARQALAEGKIIPLRLVLDRVEKEYGGQVVKIEFEHDDDDDDDDDDEAPTPWLYKIKLLQDSGNMLKLLVNAEDGKILKAKGKTHHEKRQDKD